MSKVIRISDELYEIIENTSFNNGVKMQHIIDSVLKEGIKTLKENDNLVVCERGRNVQIKW